MSLPVLYTKFTDTNPPMTKSEKEFNCNLFQGSSSGAGGEAVDFRPLAVDGEGLAAVLRDGAYAASLAPLVALVPLGLAT